MTQILIRLLGNAVKFTQKGTVSVSVEKGAGSVKIKVADTGIGIKKEDMEQLFNPFVQLENSLVRKFEGPGLGLSVARKLVEMLHGSISVQSEYGKGTTFMVELPLGIK